MNPFPRYHFRAALRLSAAAVVFALAGAFIFACSDDDSQADQRQEQQAEPGTVRPQPDGSTRVNVTLQEWGVVPDALEIPAGRIYFYVENIGPDDPHEFLIIRIGDTNVQDIPVVDGSLPEDEVDIIDEIEPFATGSSASIVVDLTPGRYLLLCNIAEIEDGELESHFELGMRTIFEVN